MNRSTENATYANQARRQIYFLKNNLFNDYHNKFHDLYDIRTVSFLAYVSSSVLTLYIYVGFQMCLFIGSFLLFVAVFSKIHILFFNLVEILMYFGQEETDYLKAGIKVFSRLIEQREHPIH